MGLSEGFAVAVAQIVHGIDSRKIRIKGGAVIGGRGPGGGSFRGFSRRGWQGTEVPGRVGGRAILI